LRHAHAERAKRVEAILAFRYWRQQLPHAGDEVNSNGNTVWRDVDADSRIGFRGRERYVYDARLLPDGWAQYDTKQDASYFGVWVQTEARKLFTYCEGDRTLVECPSNEAFANELRAMEAFYGSAPPAFVVIHRDGRLTEIYSRRPSL
jgi:hypothetical protein